MKTILSALFALGTIAFAAESVIPERLPRERYNKLVEDWPFSVATAVKNDGPPPENVFSHLFLSSFGRITEGGVEKEWVVIKDQHEQGRLIELLGTEADEEGFQLIKVNWADDPKDVTAKVKKGSEMTDNLKTDQAAWANNTTVPTVTPAGGRPGALNPRAGGVGGIPLPNGGANIKPQNSTIVQPQNRGVLPRPNAVPTPQAIKVAPGTTPAGANAPRIRTIPSPK